MPAPVVEHQATRSDRSLSETESDHSLSDVHYSASEVESVRCHHPVALIASLLTRSLSLRHRQKRLLTIYLTSSPEPVRQPNKERLGRSARVYQGVTLIRTACTDEHSTSSLTCSAYVLVAGGARDQNPADNRSASSTRMSAFPSRHRRSLDQLWRHLLDPPPQARPRVHPLSLCRKSRPSPPSSRTSSRSSSRPRLTCVTT